MDNKHEQTLVIIKPDAVHRSLLGEIIHRFERKGLRIVGLKMVKLEDVVLEEHYSHLKDKPFFPGIKDFMKSAPVVLLVLEGYNAINATRLIVGPTKGYEADAGSIRGDFSLSTQSNIVHASDSVENGKIEVGRFFTKEELHEYTKAEYPHLYAPDEQK